MFEIVMCISLYTLVLSLEFIPWLLERLQILTGIKNFLEKKVVLFVLVILGIMLSYGHQSSLGGLFLITPEKLSPLWYSHFIHHLFFLSAICVGLSMVSCETIISANMRNKEYETHILQGLAKGTAIALWVYFLVRFVDLAVNGNLVYIFSGDAYTSLFLIEVGLGVIVPMLLLSTQSIRQSIQGLLTCHGLVIFGVILNRFNVVFLPQTQMGETFYFPSWQEFLITIGLVSAGLFMYKLIVTYLPVFQTPSEERA
jgi:Ni/Fe-hydrogenase subunit HybB-like protein